MKTTILILSLVLGAVKVSAQFFFFFYLTPNISPGMVMSMSPAQLEMAQNAHLAQVRAQTNALYMQTMQMMQARTAAAYNNVMNFQFTPTMPMPVYGNVEVYAGNPDGTPIETKRDRPQKTRHTCSLCNGTGQWVKYNNSVGCGNKGYMKRCSTCGETYWSTSPHFHLTCPQCHGRGYKEF